MNKLLAAFTIQELVNTTDSEMALAITLLGTPAELVHEEILLAAHQTVNCLLSFGRQETAEYLPPGGYVFTNRTSAVPFKTIRCIFLEAEDPLVTIPVLHEYHFKSLPHVGSWALFCNEKKVGTFSSAEHKRMGYKIIIGENCRIEVIAQQILLPYTL